ncbi:MULTISPECIES: nucleotidyltransferase domain-containing protein [Curtobacterium]|uniref:nucleotidyltransferase domain-containing protein n=1 Tax=Curtobacterium TaxID=2034 RepID=UPI00217CF3C2|nr:nucleotidyltransferase domain-containing protein [Curtobacterium flaccumfaciens]MCS6562300.1 nucleotidyltransferase domain-containing protein [Curtobacterium flaccumfaciens pv. poinsettiae]UXN28369.1 nucleotidyltransferase domain-containing protein [Curtobacterium flaccumfaciens]
MSLMDSFASFQTVVNADPDQVSEARRRRRVFEEALVSEPDVLEVVPSGSLARGTHKDPIHDVDLVVVYDPVAHPDWGVPGASASEALDHARAAVNRLLGATSGTVDQLVRLAKPRNHAVKCFLDDPDDEDAFTVDVMPALRVDAGFRIPESLSEAWIDADPEYLIAEAARKHGEWSHYAGTVRMLKYWAASQSPLKIKSLVMEVLALEHLATGLNRPTAISSFFTAAAFQIESGLAVEDPAGLCGEIQRDLDMGAFSERLRAASNSGIDARASQVANDPAAASRHWREVFGDEFPEILAAAGATVVPDGPRPVKDSPQG